MHCYSNCQNEKYCTLTLRILQENLDDLESDITDPQVSLRLFKALCAKSSIRVVDHI